MESIESGDFSFLPDVYVRLFLRAYCTEIGADTNDVLNQLEIFLSEMEGLPQQQSADVKEETGEGRIEEYDVSEQTPFQLRTNLIKVGVLLAVIVFAIFVIKRITTTEPEITTSTEASFDKEYVPDAVTDEQLAVNYRSEVRQARLHVDPPFRLTLSTTEPIWYRLFKDDEPPLSTTLLAGGEIIADFKAFFKLRVDRAINIDFKINESPVNIDFSKHPVDISYQSDSGELNIIVYFPK